MAYRPDFFALRFARKPLASANRAVLESPPVEQIACYDDLRQALNRRRVDLGMSFEELDGVTGLADHYTSKILSAPATSHGRYHRSIGSTAMNCLLPALRVRLRLEPVD
jgi:hypothetical protein